MRQEDPLVETVRRDQAIPLAALIGITGVAWAYMVRMAARMPEGQSCHGMAAPQAGSWDTGEILMAFSMWVAMMVAMMLPIVSPWVLALSKTQRERDPRQAPFGVAGYFLLGYIVIWIGYSGLATAGQWGLREAALLSPGLVATSPVLGGVMLLAAGIYQWTPWRDACMKHCRSPMGFFLASWKEGSRGAFPMGFPHGLYCVGCCWILMALSFVIVAEKVTSWGPGAGRAAGVVLAAYGVWMLA